MSGCRWQEKSFSVAKSEKVVNKCFICGIDISDNIFKYNDDTLCKACFQNKEPIRKTEGIGEFYTSKDKLWEFGEDFGTKHYEIRTKGQWKKYLREHGLNDDIKQSKRKPSDYIQPKFEKSNKKYYADCMLKELHDKELYHKLIKRRK